MKRSTLNLLSVLLLVLCAGSTTGVGAEEFLISSPAGGSSKTNPDVGFGGGQYFVAWQKDDNIHGTRVLPDGTVLDVGGIQLPEYSGSVSGPDEKAAVAFDGTQFMVTYQSYIFDMGCVIPGTHLRDLILVARVAPDGTVVDTLADTLDSRCRLEEGGVETPAIASHGDGCLASWIRGSGSGIQGDSTRGAIVTPSLGKDPLEIRGYLGVFQYARSPAVAYGGGNYLAAWADFRDVTTYDLYAARVTPSGTVLDPDGNLVSSAGSADEDLPAIAFGASTFLVVWQRSGEIRGARIATDGTVLDPDGFIIHGGSSADVAFDGTSFLVVWQEGSPDTAIYGANVFTDGSVSASFRISDEGSVAATPSVAFDGTRSLVVWRRSSGGEVDIYGAFAAATTPPEWEAGVAESEASDLGIAETRRSRTVNALWLGFLPLAFGILKAFRGRKQAP